MTDTDGTAHRSLHYDAPADAVEFRDSEEVESEDGLMELRIPIASTGDVRNEGDDPLSTRELRGMAEQINTLSKGVFPEHGKGDFVEYGKYSQFEKLGYWADAELEREAASDGADLLMATARMPDPEPMPKQTGDYRQALAILKEQAVRGIPISASIGWRDDEEMPGGVDLMEASIVGIGADPRTNTGGGEQLVARAAVEAGADPDALVETVRDAVENDRPFGTPQAPDLWDDFEECVADVEDWDGVDDPEAFCAWAQDQTESDADDPEDTHEMSTPDSTRTMTEFLNEQFQAEVQRRVEANEDMTEEQAEQEVEDDLATETGRDPSTIDNILSGDIECPVIDPVVEGFAEVLDFDVEDAVAAAPECDYDMSDNNADADGEQDGGDAETERAPEDVTEDDLLTFTATHFDGMDEGDLAEAVDAADAEYIGECDAEALFDFVSIVTGAEYGDVEDAMGELMGGEQSDDMDDDEEEEDDEDEQSSDEPDEEQSTDDTDEERGIEELHERMDEFESDLEAVRSGEVDVDTPDTEDERDAGEQEEPDGEETDERDAESQEPRSLRDEVLGVDQ
jgi:hypothetical protein